MEEFSTAPIPSSTRAEDHERPPAHAGHRQAEHRPHVAIDEPEANEPGDAPENGEPKHYLDISV